MVEVFLAVMIVLSIWSHVGADIPPLQEEVDVIAREVSYSDVPSAQYFEKLAQEQRRTLRALGCKRSVSSATDKGDGTATIIITTKCTER